MVPFPSAALKPLCSIVELATVAVRLSPMVRNIPPEPMPDISKGDAMPEVPGLYRVLQVSGELPWLAFNVAPLSTASAPNAALVASTIRCACRLADPRTSIEDAFNCTKPSPSVETIGPAT